MNPFVSVVIPVFNAERFIYSTVKSIIDQTFSNFELLIINDASTDTTEKIINSFMDNRIRIIKTKGIGATEAYNIGFKYSIGKYIAISDHDDISEKDRLKKQVVFLENNPEVNVLGTNYNVINENGSFLFSVLQPQENLQIKELLLKRASGVFNPSLMVRREIFDKYGYYHNNYFPVSDYEFYLRNSDFLHFHNLEDMLYNWRNLKTSISHNKVDLFNKKLYKVSYEYIYKKFYKTSKKDFYENMSFRAYYTNHLLLSAYYSIQSFLKGKISGMLIKMFINSTVFYIPVKIMRKLWLVENPLFLSLKQKVLDSFNVGRK
ncbi:MAG: glycosyltransferase [Ignavibacteria bacterium]|nr:glycosyltransferase [Ignavibacteria bacterium]